MSWNNMNTNKKIITKSCKIEDKDALQSAIYEMQEQGLCIVTLENETTKTYKIGYCIERQEMKEDAIRALINKNVTPIKFKPVAPLKKSGKNVAKQFSTGNKVMAIINIADFHLNRFTNGLDGFGDPYDIEIGTDVFKGIIAECKDRLQKNGHIIERIVLNTGGDFLNSDTPVHTTTNGTPQSDSTSYKQALRRGCDLLEFALLELSKIAPVEYYYVAGNHDEQQGLAITFYLEARFRESKNIKVDIATNSRATIKYGNNLVVLAHGDYEGARAIDLPFTEPNAKSHLSVATNMEVLIGHKHNPDMKCKNGVRLETLGSACPVGCDWTYNSGYGDGNPEATIVYYDNDYRVQQDTIYTRRIYDERMSKRK